MIVDGDSLRPDILETYIKNRQAVPILPPKPVNKPDPTLEDKTVVELKEIAKDKGVTGYSTMVKADLIREITEAS